MLTVNETTFLGEAAIFAENDDLSIILVPGWGSNVVSLIDKQKSIHILRTPKSVEEYREIPVLYGIPILFPPNRIEDGIFSFQEQTYHFHINEPEENNHSHGLVFEEKWKLLRYEVVDNRIIIETSIHSADHPKILEQFPHHFQIIMQYILEGPSLQVNTSVNNTGQNPFPWGLGFHTTFNFPFDPVGSLRDCSFSLTADQKWELNERFLPTGKLFDIPSQDPIIQGMDLTDKMLDDVFQASVQKNGKNVSILEDRRSGVQIIYEADKFFKQWVIYNADSRQGYLCPEPYTWVTNAPNLTSLPDDLTGFKVIQPGERVRLNTKLTLKEL